MAAWEAPLTEEAQARSSPLLFASMLALAVLSGTLLRVWLGLRTEVWRPIPDQMAWTLLLEEAVARGARVDQWVHYPHEMGSALYSAVALVVGPLGELPALSWAALFVDTSVRGIQVFVAWRLFGRTTAGWFALWSVAAVPMLLPWATITPGLHYSASVWPFLFLWALLKPPTTARAAIVLGLCMGSAVAFSYNSVALLAVGAACLLAPVVTRHARPSIAAAGLLSCAAILIGHLAIRALAPLGFELERLGTLSVRNVEDSSRAWSDWPMATYDFATSVFPNGLFASPFEGSTPSVVGMTWLALCFVGVALAPHNRRVRIGAAIVLLYCAIYTASPFQITARPSRSFFDYRHLTTIVPLLALIGVHGWTQAKGFRRLPVVLLAAAGAAALLLHWQPTSWVDEPAPTQQAGWILGRKLGHDPPRLAKIAEDSIEADELLFGYGWGTATALLALGNPKLTGGVDRLVELIDAYPMPSRRRVFQGARQAFDPSVTPALPSDDLRALEESLWTRRLETDGTLVEVRDDQLAFYTNGSAVYVTDAPGPLSVLASGSSAAGQGARLTILVPGSPPRSVELGPEPIELPLGEVMAKQRVELRFDNDAEDESGGDRNVLVWWIGPPS